jgi:hypothetical protein
LILQIYVVTVTPIGPNPTIVVEETSINFESFCGTAREKSITHIVNDEIDQLIKRTQDADSHMLTRDIWRVRSCDSCLAAKIRVSDFETPVIGILSIDA